MNIDRGSIVIFLLLCLLYDKAAESFYTPRIVNGENAKLGQFPYMASIRLAETYGHICGGSILTPEHILTAAHCVHQMQVDDLFVVTGTISTASGGAPSSIYKIRIHDDYIGSANHWKDDIAIIKLARPIKFNAFIQMLPLPTRNASIGELCTVNGWGKTFPVDVTLPSILQTTKQHVIENKKCGDAFNVNFGEGRLCAIFGDGNVTGICQGDSGGPLVCDGEQQGIVSFNMPCAVRYPDAYTRVLHYIDWINQQIKDM